MSDLLGETFPRDELKEAVAALAREQMFVGTSSWKYEGWLGMLYTPERYWTRGRVSRAKFEKNCLSEYAEVFKTVCLDAGYYQFPSAAMLDTIFSQVPGDFRLSLKVTEEITVKRFSSLPRYGTRAGHGRTSIFLMLIFLSRVFLGRWSVIVGRSGRLSSSFRRFKPASGSGGCSSLRRWTAFWGGCRAGGITRWRCATRAC